ncbi:MAG: NahK/ErcS family hybrid sensor histidine kinase/response regulator [Pseudomonadota bacterium]
MINSWLLLAACAGYVALLFVIARFGDRVADDRLSPRWRAITYSLALAVYCTSWTFYGAVGTAATSGWLYLPIYLGPILVIALGWPFLTRVIAISRRQNLTSIADFLAARYGRSHGLGVMITVIAVVGSVPYIALQLQAVGTGFAIVSETGAGDTPGFGAGLAVTLALAGFAILFGTRKVDVTDHHDGMMLAIAFESVVKLIAFVLVGVFALGLLRNGVASSMPGPSPFAQSALPQTFMTQLLLAGAAILCLPRQFHAAVVEARADADIGIARWLFPIYLLVFSVLVVPITLAGLGMLSGTGITGDSFVLALPMQAGSQWLTLIAFLGGFSAATGMVIVACVALSTMISNECVVPLVVRARGGESRDYARLVLYVRRVAIAVIALLAWRYQVAAAGNTALASMGLLSFAAAAQFAPLLIAGVYWRGAHRRGAIAGLACGFALWTYTLFLPTLARAGLISTDFIEQGLFGLTWLRPEALIFETVSAPLTHGVAWSLIVNTFVLIGVSLAARHSMLERIQAATFAGVRGIQAQRQGDPRTASITHDDLRALAGRFVGGPQAGRSFADFAVAEGIELAPSASADPRVIRFTERLVAGAVGAASARVVMTTALRDKGSRIEDVFALLDETSEAIRFNQQLVEATLENMTQGVSVVDAEQRLVGWNRRYLELMGYPDDLLYRGQPVAELIRHNAAQGHFGDLDPEIAVNRRLKFLKSGSAYTYESHFVDGRVIEIRGQPMPGGGFVTTFTDITGFKATESALEAAKAELEQRVAARTSELTNAMRDLEAARQDAEQANASKTRFLAAAAHDLLQPLNATRLFATLLNEQGQALKSEQRELVTRIQSGLGNVEDLLGALLDISRLDTAAPVPQHEAVRVATLFEGLRGQFAPGFEESGLTLRFQQTDNWVHSDAAMLRRILQNFLSNARRYTSTGGVLVGCRRRGDHIALQVIDTGMGIADDDCAVIFEEFRRLPGSDRAEKRGLGLGLAIVARIARLLGHDIGMRSTPGRGSTFEVVVPGAAPIEITPAATRSTQTSPRSSLVGEHVVIIDNEPEIVDGMAQLLERWGALPLPATDGATAIEAVLALRKQARRLPALLLVDYHLDDGATGIEAVQALRKKLRKPIPAIIITADHSEPVARAAADADCELLNKPLKPAALRALVANLLGRRGAA